MRRIKNIGFVIHSLLIIIGLFLIFKMPSSNAFFLLVTSSYLLLFFVKSLKISSTVSSTRSYEDQIQIIGSDVILSNKPSQLKNTIESKTFHPMRFWSILMGFSHLIYGSKEMLRILVSGNLPVLSPMNGLLFVMKLLLLFSGVITFLYVFIVKYFSVG